jgi:hypothetical protein
VTGIIRVKLDGLGIVIDGTLPLAAQTETENETPLKISTGIIRVKLDGLGVVLDGILVLA